MVPSASIFRIAITTKYLLSLALKTGHICADTTYKLIWQGFPVLVVGTTDLQRHFHPVSVYLCSNESTEDFIFIFSNLKESISIIHFKIYSPKILVADGAEQITNAFIKVYGPDYLRVMCWAHVERAVDKRLKLINNTKIEQEILGDIYHIQISYSKDIFNFLISLFVDKWSKVNEPVINDFLEYFRTMDGMRVFVI